jgi:hypothetical protein
LPFNPKTNRALVKKQQTPSREQRVPLPPEVLAYAYFTVIADRLSGNPVKPLSSPSNPQE